VRGLGGQPLGDDVGINAHVHATDRFVTFAAFEAQSYSVDRDVHDVRYNQHSRARSQRASWVTVGVASKVH
jgi:hypothetical protein